MKEKNLHDFEQALGKEILSDERFRDVVSFMQNRIKRRQIREQKLMQKEKEEMEIFNKRLDRIEEQRNKSKCK
jgi:hypothetical protein